MSKLFSKFWAFLSGKTQKSSPPAGTRTGGGGWLTLLVNNESAKNFYSALGEHPRPDVVTITKDLEDVFEWFGTSGLHLVVSFDRGEEYKYSYVVDGKVVPGRHRGFCGRELPEDLRNYLDDIARNPKITRI